MKKLILLFIVIGFTQTIHAQGVAIGPVLGYHKAPDAEEGSFLGGAAVRLKLSKTFGVEGAFLVRSEKYAKNTIKVTNYPVMVTGLFYPLPIVYGAVGAGWYNSKIEYRFDTPVSSVTDEQTVQDFGWHFGAGVELPLSYNINLHGDIRYVFLNYEFEDVPGSNVENDFIMINVGLLFEL